MGALHSTLANNVNGNRKGHMVGMTAKRGESGVVKVREGGTWKSGKDGLAVDGCVVVGEKAAVRMLVFTTKSHDSYVVPRGRHALRNFSSPCAIPVATFTNKINWEPTYFLRRSIITGVI